MLKNLTRRRTILILGVIAALACSGVALAYFSTTGSGDGSATVGSSDAVTIAQDGTITNLVPGGAAQSINFTITNPKSTPQHINGVTVKLKVTQAEGAVGTCSTDDFKLVQPTVAAADLTTGPHAYAGTASGASLQMINTDTSQDGCKGASIALTITAS